MPQSEPNPNDSVTAYDEAGDTVQDLPDAEGPSPPDLSIEEQLNDAKARAEEHYERMLRISAEFDNYKKRTSREIGEIRKYAYEALCRDLLTVVDNLERAMEAGEGGNSAEESMLEGIRMTHKELLKVLETYHVQPVEALGKPFDPSVHQAMLQEPSKDTPPNTVIREFNRGYMIRDRLLRPAMVVVAKGSPAEEE
jgi:molecular chaperone GrpE